MKITNKKRARLVGILILIAYSMLTYTITKNIPLGIITDILSGLAVIGIPILMFPLFNTLENKNLNYAYIFFRMIEGILMILGGIIILIPELKGLRELMYENIHIYFFIAGALCFYALLYRSKIIPEFISLLGIFASLALVFMVYLQNIGIESNWMILLVLPIILNELFLAFWLIFKGFNKKVTNKLN